MKVSVGISIDSYSQLPITHENVLNITNSTVVVYIDKETNDRLNDYYRGIKAILRNNNNRLVVILGTEESNITPSIINLCLMYDCFNIYKEIPSMRVTKEYIDTLLARKPSKKEVEMYISRSSVAIEDIDALLLEVRTMAEEGTPDELIEYLKVNSDLINQLPNVFTELKSLLDPLNKVHEEDFKELQTKYEISQREADDALKKTARLTESVRDKEIVIAQLNKDIKEAESQRDSYKTMYTDASSKMARLESDNRSLSDTLKRSESTVYDIITTTRVNMIPGCNAKGIIYFKEVSRPRYFNSFVKFLAMYIDMLITGNKKGAKATKIIIFDNRKEYVSIYKTLRVFSADNYAHERLDALRRDIVVFLDWNPSYLEDMLRGAENPYSYYIIVDRMNAGIDLIDGANVAKFLAFSSSKECENYILDRGTQACPPIVPSSNGKRPLAGTIEIQRINDYPSTEPAALAKWVKMANPASQHTCYEDILAKIGVQGRRGPR